MSAEPTAGIDITPGVSILGVLGHLNYEPWFALAEYVDNAVQSAAKTYVSLVAAEADFKLRVDITHEREGGGRIVISDNAGGIARRDFARAFKAAEAPPDRSGLSEFGMGMKSASIWFARRWRVTTTSIGDENAYVVEFDMRSVLDQKLRQVEVQRIDAERSSHFTKIELWELNQTLAGRTLGKVRDHLREIYRTYLRDGRLALTVGGQRMEYVEPAVLVAADYRSVDDAVALAPVTWRKDVALELDNGVKVHGWAAIRAEGKTGGNGLSLFRRGRVIMGTGDTPYRPSRIYGQGNSYRSQRLFGELQVDGLPVSHTKDGFQWLGVEDEFEEELRAVLDAEPLPLLRQAENYRARQANRLEKKRVSEATSKTAAVAKVGLPKGLDGATEAGRQSDPVRSGSNPYPDHAAVDEGQPQLQIWGSTEQSIRFMYRDSEWIVLLTTCSQPAETRWLIRHSEFDAATGSTSVSAMINIAHPFVRNFALGTTDSVEAILRLATALVVSEALSRSAGDGEVISAFFRQVDSLLTSALASRLGDLE